MPNMLRDEMKNRVMNPEALIKAASDRAEQAVSEFQAKEAQDEATRFVVDTDQSAIKQASELSKALGLALTELDDTGIQKTAGEPAEAVTGDEAPAGEP